MGYDPINKLPHIQRMNSLRGDPVNLDGSKINIQDKEVTPDKIKRALSASLFVTFILDSIINVRFSLLGGGIVGYNPWICLNC